MTQRSSQNNKSNFPVVGIAASAGGLEAFTQLLSHLPIDTGMAFVLILHLSPDRESLLTRIFALLRSTTGVDFSHYKPKTIERRIHRRMLLCHLKQLADYVTYLVHN